MTAPLAAGATMPSIFATDLEGAEVDLTATVAGHWAAVLIYRGHW